MQTTKRFVSLTYKVLFYINKSVQHLQERWASSGGSAGRSSVVRVDWHSSTSLVPPGIRKANKNVLMFPLSNIRYAACWANPITLTSRCWWLLWREARRSWSSWEAEWRAEGVSSSVLPSEASWMRFCKALCCSWRSWNCFFFSSSTCSNLEKRSRKWHHVNYKCLQSLTWFRVFNLGICPPSSKNVKVANDFYFDKTPCWVDNIPSQFKLQPGTDVLWVCFT